MSARSSRNARIVAEHLVVAACPRPSLLLSLRSARPPPCFARMASAQAATAQRPSGSYDNISLEDAIHPSQESPTLDTLESFRPMPPRQRRRARELSPRELKQEETTHAHKAWDKTLKRITDAFTRAQLVELGLQAGVTGIRGRAKRKDDVARAILRQYFELADPAELEAAARADNVSKIFVLGEAELFVFLARGQYHVRELGRNFDVELNVRRSPDPDTGYQLNASGPKDGIAGLAGWLTDFKQSISTRQIDLDSILARSSSHRPQPVPSHLLHMISRTSHCWLEPINEGERSLLISFTHEEDYALAVAMLRQQQVESLAAASRPVLAYACDPKAPETGLMQYSMLPQLLPEPVPWQLYIPSGDGSSSSQFRIRRVAEGLQGSTLSPANAQRDVFDPSSPRHDEVESPLDLLALDEQELKQDASAESRKVESADVAAQTPTTRVSASFGHLIFNDVPTGAEPPRSQLQALLQAPLEGSWPLAHAFEWLYPPTPPSSASPSESLPKRTAHTLTFIPTSPPVSLLVDLTRSRGGQREWAGWNPRREKMEEVVRLTYCVGSTDSQSLRAPPMRFVCELVEEARKEEVDGTRDAMSADMASDPDTSRVEASSSDEGAEQTTTTLNDEPAAADKLPSSADADQVSAAEKEAPAVSKSEAEPVPEESEERWGVHAPSFEEMSRARQGGRTEGEQSSSSASVEPPRSRTQLVVKNAYWLRSAEMDMLVPESAVDLRLARSTIVPASKELDGLRSYIDEVNEYLRSPEASAPTPTSDGQNRRARRAPNNPPTPLPLILPGRPSPPSTIDLGSSSPSIESSSSSTSSSPERMFLERAERVSRTIWESKESHREASQRELGVVYTEHPLERDSPRMVEESVITDGEAGMRTSFRLEWDQPVPSTTSPAPAPSTSSTPPTPTTLLINWPTITKYLDVFLNNNYQSLSGRSKLR